MRIVIKSSASKAIEFARDEMVSAIRRHPSLVLGLATGGTMEPLYDALVDENKSGRISFSQVTTFNLDEYIGIPASSSASYRTYMNQRLFDRVDIDISRTHVPTGDSLDICAEGRRYEGLIAHAGGIDFQLLGIGSDGHIGFNEPGSSLASRTRVKSLAKQTRLDNARFFESIDAVPKNAITMGIATILDARRILLLATGRGKADAIAKAVEGPVSALITASALQLHPHVTVVIDDDAASALQHAEDYKFAEEQRNLLDNQRKS